VGRLATPCTAYLVRHAFPLVEGQKMRPTNGDGLTADNSQPAKTHAYFSPSWTAFQADRGRHFSVIVDGISN
jgi:hypothetical protein